MFNKIIAWLSRTFSARTVESEAARGAANALEFLASDPSPELFMEYYGAARSCVYFDNSSLSRAYDMAASKVLEPHLETMRSMLIKK